MRTPLQRAALLALGAVLLGTTLQGCSVPEVAEPKSSDLPLEICPAFRFSGSGRVEETRAGDIVQVTCPTDFVYSGPVLECGWVDRFCIAQEGEEIDPELCWKEYNLTLLGHGLADWPSSVEPKRVPPPLHGQNVSVPVNAHGDIIAPPPNASKIRGDAAPADIHVVRRLAARRRDLGTLPTVITPEQLKCSDEPYVDLDFELAHITQNNLGGFNIDKTAPQTLQFGKVARMHSRSIDLVISAPTASGEASGLGDPGRNGKGSAMGRINVNSSKGVPLQFRFISSDDQTPVILNKVYFTIFDIAPGLVRPNPPKGLEVIVESLAQYHIAPKSRVKVEQNNTQYKFFPGNVDPAALSAQPPAVEAQAADDAADAAAAGDGGASQVTVKDLWLDSLNGSVALVFRNVSEFTLVVSTEPSAKGRDFEFTGWSEIVQEGRRVLCGGAPQEEEGKEAKAAVQEVDATEAAARAALEKKFHLTGGAPVLRHAGSRWRGLLVSLGLSAVAISVVLAARRRQARVTRAQYGVLLSS